MILRQIEPDISSPVNDGTALLTIEFESEVTSSTEPALLLTKEPKSGTVSLVIKELGFITTTDTELDVISSVEIPIKSTIKTESSIISFTETALESDINVELDVIYKICCNIHSKSCFTNKTRSDPKS